MLKRLNKLKDKYQARFKDKLTFRNTVLAAVILIAFLLILNTFLYKPPTSSFRQEEGGVTVISRVFQDKEFIAKYKIVTVNTTKVLVIYINDDTSLVANDYLINAILTKENLSSRDVIISLRVDENLAQRDINILIEEEMKIPDPTNPLYAVPENVPLNPAENNFENVDFTSYINTIDINNENFEIFRLEENKYQIRLKNDYTPEKFQKEFVSKFINTDEIEFIYMNENELWLENP